MRRNRQGVERSCRSFQVERPTFGIVGRRSFAQLQREKKFAGRPISRVLCPRLSLRARASGARARGERRGNGHLSSPPIARRIEQPTRGSSRAGTSPAPIFGLAPGGVCRASLSPGCWWALTPPFHPYPLPAKPQAVRRVEGGIFLLHCPCPSPALPPTSDGGHYPPPRPVEPGLSSPRPLTQPSPQRRGEGRVRGRATTVQPTCEPTMDCSRYGTSRVSGRDRAASA